MDGYPLRQPDPAGFPLTGEIRLQPDFMWQAGRIFTNYIIPICTKSDVTAQINSWYQQRKSAHEACQLM